MNDTFLKNVITAIGSAGWLMIGTGVLILIFERVSTVGDSLSTYGILSIVVGACFVIIKWLSSYFLNKK